MGKQKKMKVKPVPVIPVQDVQVTDDSRRKAAAARQQRGGVASTVLSDVLGG